MGMLRVSICGASGIDNSHLTVNILKELAYRGLADSVTVEITGSGQDIGLNRPSDPTHLVLLLGLHSHNDADQITDQAIRCSLARSGQPFDVLYGSSAERLSQALEIVERRLPGMGQTGQIGHQPAANRADSKSTRQWTWICDKCSDPVCEHRLLSDLLIARLT